MALCRGARILRCSGILLIQSHCRLIWCCAFKECWLVINPRRPSCDGQPWSLFRTASSQGQRRRCTADEFKNLIFEDSRRNPTIRINIVLLQCDLSSFGATVHEDLSAILNSDVGICDSRFCAHAGVLMVNRAKIEFHFRFVRCMAEKAIQPEN